MTKRLLFACIAASAFCAEAAPIVFFDSFFRTEAIASAGVESDLASDSSPPSVLPLTSSVAVGGGVDSASAAATGGVGLLTAAADTASDAGFAFGFATSQFVGSFFGEGPSRLIFLRFDFETSSAASGTGESLANLFVQLSADGEILFDQFFAAGGPIALTFTLPQGALATLDLLLLSQAITFEGGQAGNIASVGIDAQIPLPGTIALLLLGLLLLVFARTQTPRAWMRRTALLRWSR